MAPNAYDNNNNSIRYSKISVFFSVMCFRGTHAINRVLISCCFLGPVWDMSHLFLGPVLHETGKADFRFLVLELEADILDVNDSSFFCDWL